MDGNKQGERISQKPVQAYDSAYQTDIARALNMYRYFKPMNPVPEGEAPLANAQPAVSTTTESEQNVNNSRASSMPDSLKDKRVNHEGTSDIETSATLPGLPHRSSERSQGTNTADGGPALTRENPAAAIAFDNDNNGVNIPKRAKKVAKRVCTECRTLDTPQWRIGPNGRNTLCNACGLSLGKKERKERNMTTGIPFGVMTDLVGGSLNRS